jgi:hypothetical protein
MPAGLQSAETSLLGRLSNLRIPKAVSYAIFAAAAVAFCLSVWYSFHRNLDFAWTSIRLAPAFALVHGLPLYSAPETPPWVMVGYGPFYPAAYLPSTLSSTPGLAVAIGTLLAHTYILVPVGLLCGIFARRLEQGGLSSRASWSALLLFFALLTGVVPSLNYVTTQIHVDAPALGLFLLAALFVLRAEKEDNAAVRWIALAGVCAGLSAACKINLAPATIGFFLWILLSLGIRRALVLALAAALAFCAVYGLAALRDGLAPVLLNLTLTAKLPWHTFQEGGALAVGGTSHDVVDKVRALLTIVSDYIREYGAIVVLLLLLLPRLREQSPSAARMIQFFLFLALIMVPASAMALGKSGGDVNSRALVTLPLTLAALFAFAVLVQQPRGIVRAARSVALLGATFAVAFASGTGLLRLSLQRSSTMVEAHTTVTNDPGRWYFPFDPVAHLLAEGKFRPSMDVIHSYAAAGLPVTKEAFQSTLPDRMEYIAVPPLFASWGIDEMQRLMPEFYKTLRNPDLFHHQVISR